MNNSLTFLQPAKTRSLFSAVRMYLEILEIPVPKCKLSIEKYLMKLTIFQWKNLWIINDVDYQVKLRSEIKMIFSDITYFH